MVANNRQTHRQTTYKCYPIVPGGKSARDKSKNKNRTNTIDNYKKKTTATPTKTAAVMTPSGNTLIRIVIIVYLLSLSLVYFVYISYPSCVSPAYLSTICLTSFSLCLSISPPLPLASIWVVAPCSFKALLGASESLPIPFLRPFKLLLEPRGYSHVTI